MRKEIIQTMIEFYRESIEKDKKLIGKKKSSVQINNSLFHPSDDFKERLMNTSNLDKELFETIVNNSEQRFKIIEPYIKSLCEEIPIIVDDKEIEDEMVRTFFSNKYLSDSLTFVENYLNKEFILSPFDWAYNEFVFPFFLVNVMSIERAKAISFMKELSDENKQFKTQPSKKINQEEELITNIIKTKNLLKKQKPGKKISVSAVAKALKIPDSSFRDNLKVLKKTKGIIFNNL